MQLKAEQKKLEAEKAAREEAEKEVKFVEEGLDSAIERRNEAEAQLKKAERQLERERRERLRAEVSFYDEKLFLLLYTGAKHYFQFDLRSETDALKVQVAALQKAAQVPSGPNLVSA